MVAQKKHSIKDELWLLEAYQPRCVKDKRFTVGSIVDGSEQASERASESESESECLNSVF